MLKRIALATFVALLPLAWAGDGTAEPKTTKESSQSGSQSTSNPNPGGGGKSDLGQKLQFQLNEANSIFTRTKPKQPSHGSSQGVLGGGLLDNSGGGFNQNAAGAAGKAMAPPAGRGAGQVIK